MSNGFEQIGGKRVFRPWKSWTPGDSITGKFTGTFDDDYGKTNYEIVVESVDFEEGSVPYKTNAGKEGTYEAPLKSEIFVLSACGSLDNAMDKVDEGDIVRVTYTGQEVLKKGKFAGKNFHTMKVERKKNSVVSATTEVELDDDVL